MLHRGYARRMVVRANEIELSEDDLRRISNLFEAGTLEKIGGFENLLYRSASGRVVRLTHTSRRDVGLVDAEFAFMDHLARQDVPVVAPIESTNGRLVEELTTESGQGLVAACMTEAPGGIRRSPGWSPDEIESYGSLLGRMHEAAASFRAAVRRPDWTNPIFDVGLGSDNSEPDLQRRLAEIKAAGADHPAGSTDLLIHQDAHFGNLFITEGGEITIFDFDDCAYGSPTHDVAIVLFYWVLGHDNPSAEAKRFLGHFLRGYEQHASLPTDWAIGADLFLAYREIDIFWLVLTEDPEDSSPGELRFMDGRRERILDGVPYLGVPLADVI